MFRSSRTSHQAKHLLVDAAFSAPVNMDWRSNCSKAPDAILHCEPKASMGLPSPMTRSGAAIVSEPVNLAVLGTLRPEGGDLRAVIRRGGQAIGRLQARLQPVGAGTSWTSRLLAAPLSGGIRYNGPASVLWSLAGLADQQLSGPIGLAADFGGRVQSPQLTGVVRANALGYVNETYGTRIRNIRPAGRFTNDRLEITQFTGQAGEGTVSGTGSASG